MIPTVAISPHVPAVPVFRSMRKPVSFVLASVHAKFTWVADAAVAASPVGAVGIGVSETFNLMEPDAAPYPSTAIRYAVPPTAEKVRRLVRLPPPSSSPAIVVSDETLLPV